MTVKSEVGKGTDFTIALPLTSGSIEVEKTV
jgi:chemotaxis protein histidine kinase CheA